MLTAISPVDGAVLGTYASTDADAIQQQVASARKAAGSWHQTSVNDRLKCLEPLTGLVLNNMDALCDTLMQTTGKVRTEALIGEIYPILGLASYYQQQAVHILRYRPVSTSPFAFPGSTAGIERRPFGVTAIFSPWNYPFQLSVAPLLTALIAGNAVILKMSDYSLPIGRLIIELFEQLNLPPGLVQWAVGAAACGEQLIDAGPDLIFFTGNVGTGRAVMQRAARHPIPVLLELGGKDPMLVFADADLERACSGALYGAFSNSGQVCMAVERLYVEHGCYDDFVDRLIEATTRLTVGHGEFGDLGTLTVPQQFAVLQDQYQDALDKGALASGPLVRHGNYVQPVVLWNVNHTMRIMREETYGPLLPVMPFRNEEEAVALANDTDYGLNASIWSRDIDRAHQIARQLQCGLWAVNDVLKNAGHPELPFGGVKKSGFGRYHGAAGLLSFTYEVAGLTCRSRLPAEPNWFPYSDERYRQFKGYLNCVYGTGSLYQRIKRNWQALQAFRQYSTFDLHQRWQNFKLLAPWRQN